MKEFPEEKMRNIEMFGWCVWHEKFDGNFKYSDYRLFMMERGLEMERVVVIRKGGENQLMLSG